MTDQSKADVSRRGFLHGLGAAGIAMGAASAADPPKDASGKVIPGFEKNTRKGAQPGKPWEPFSDRKVRVGIAGYGLCRFGAQFFFQNHPNVDIAAVTDLDPGRCAALAKAVGCKKTYESCEQMVKDDSIEAVFIATDAPSHARLATLALKQGKHVASAVPAVYGNDAAAEAQMLLEAVKTSGKVYTLFETSSFRRDCYAWRQQYQAGALGKLIYSEGEYYHPKAETLTGYNPKTRKIDKHGWRRGLPPMWYPTHATAYYVSVSGGRLTDVSCLGMPSLVPHLQPNNNLYGNAFGTEIALFKTTEGGMSRMAVGWDMPKAHGEKGRVYGQKTGSTPKVDTRHPNLPPAVQGGGHGGSHGHLMNDFIESIILERRPTVDIIDALNMTMAGVVAHQSALKDGQWMKIPQYEV